MQLPYTVDSFTDSMQVSFKNAVAATAGVPDYRVSIVSISEAPARRRRLLANGIVVDFSIRVPPADNFAQSEPIRVALTEPGINANLVNLGVQVVELKEAWVVSGDETTTTTALPTTSSTAPPTSSTTPPPKGYFRTSCSTWAGARSQCQAGGGDLVVILDAMKNAEVTAYMQSFSDYDSCQGPYPWIGANGCSGSSCTWVDGSPWSYAHTGFSVDDANLHFYTDGRWGTWSNTGEAIGICEG